MPLDFQTVVPIISAGLGGSVITHLVGKRVPSVDKALDRDLKREAEIAETEAQLRTELRGDIALLKKQCGELQGKYLELYEKTLQERERCTEDIQSLRAQVATYNLIAKAQGGRSNGRQKRK